ncbi:MAG: response regulator [Ignavibacteriaceae bacterium]|nr:response regulator [Ignavibacteriaceae bacterium]
MSLKKKTVFIVDDSPGIVSNLIKLFDSGKINVAGTAADVQSAQKWLETQTADFIILDIGLPDGSGLDILARMQERKIPGVSIVFTNYYSESISAKALSLGAHHVLDKSADIEQLLTLLES